MWGVDIVVLSRWMSDEETMSMDKCHSLYVEETSYIWPYVEATSFVSLHPWFFISDLLPSKFPIQVPFQKFHIWDYLTLINLFLPHLTNHVILNRSEPTIEVVGILHSTQFTSLLICISINLHHLRGFRVDSNMNEHNMIT